jgi:hypothetical protein
MTIAGLKVSGIAEPPANAAQHWSHAPTMNPLRASGKGATPMKVLVLCRPASGVDPAAAFPPHLAAERAALRELSQHGVLSEAHSPGGPGAVLGAAETFARAIPLAQADLIDLELIPLHTMPF